MYVLRFTNHIIQKIHNALFGISAYALTIAERERQYPKREVEAACRARLLQERLYFPSHYGLAQSIVKGPYLNCKTTLKDVKLAQDIYGTSEAAAAGKTKDFGPVPSKEISVPVHMRRDQSIYADVFYWHNELFVLFAFEPLDMIMVHNLPKGADNSIGMKEQIEVLRAKVLSRGYVVDKILTDGDSTLASIVDSVPGMSTVGARSQVSHAEVEIKVIKERCRAMEASLSVPVPLRLIPWLVYGAVIAHNMVCRPGHTICPRENFSGIKVDHERDVRAKFFDYIIATRIPDDKCGEEPRTAAAVYLCSTLNSQGSIYAYDLSDGACLHL